MIKEIFAPKRCGFITRTKVHVSNFAVGTLSNHPDDERTIIVICTQKLSLLVFLGIHSKVWLRSKISGQVAGIKIGSVANCATNSIVIITVEGECLIYHLDRYDPDMVEAFREDMEDPRFNQINLEGTFQTENPLKYINELHPELKMELNIWGHVDEDQIPNHPLPNEQIFSLKRNKIRDVYQSIRLGNVVRNGTYTSLNSMSQFKSRQSALFYGTTLSPRFPPQSIKSHDSDAIPHQHIKPDVKERLLYAINANILELNRIYNSN